MGAWGAFQAWKVTKPSACLGRSEKRVAEQGTQTICSPAFPSLPLLSHVPISAPMATVCQEAAAAIPAPPDRKVDRRLVLSDHSVFARVVFDHLTKRKFCASDRQENHRSCCQTSWRPCRMPTQTSR